MLHPETNVFSFDELPWSHLWLHTISSLFNTFRCNRLLGSSLQSLEFPNRPIKDIVVLESLLVEKAVEHLLDAEGRS